MKPIFASKLIKDDNPRMSRYANHNHNIFNHLREDSSVESNSRATSRSTSNKRKPSDDNMSYANAAKRNFVNNPDLKEQYSWVFGDKTSLEADPEEMDSKFATITYLTEKMSTGLTMVCDLAVLPVLHDLVQCVTNLANN